MKLHFAVKVPFSTEHAAACGRGARITDAVQRVDCLNCKKQDSYILAKDESDAYNHSAFMAQVPREFKEPWNDGNVKCRNCGCVLFREGDRTCYGHYQNFHCSFCGHVESRLTETGMSF